MSWHVLFVETGRENLAARIVGKAVDHFCSHIQYKPLIPRRVMLEKYGGNIIERARIMFAGYVFIETDSPWDIHRAAKHHCQHIYGFLRQYDYMKEVRLEEISRLIYLLDDNQTIGVSDIFALDDRVLVTNGPLQNYEGYIHKIDRRKGRAKVNFQFGGEDHLIDLSVNLLEKMRAEMVKNEILFYRR